MISVEMRYCDGDKRMFLAENLPTDLSVWGMFQHADVVVKIVMVGLIIASIATWSLFFSKYSALSTAKKRLTREYQQLASACSLEEAAFIAEQFTEVSHAAQLVTEASDERVQSERTANTEGTKERTVFRLENQVARVCRAATRGNNFLATIGSVSPFIGLFGTVWGIMNSFIGIAKTQTTNLAVVAPGIAEALLATAMGLIAAIPAVVIYNSFSRMIANYRALLRDVAAQIILLQGRDLDLTQQLDTAFNRDARHRRAG